MNAAEGSGMFHIPVLVHEVVDALVTDPAGVYVDGTLGGGGHTEAILQKLSPAGTVIAFDVDEDAIGYSRARLAADAGRIRLFRENFSRCADVLGSLGINAVRGIIVDLGISSHQIDEPRRGFSFQSDELLDMRMDDRIRVTARDVINSYDEKQLADIFERYGEERRSRVIARAVVRERAKHPFDTTGRLASVISGIVGERYTKKSLARIFQAIRIEINGELRHLDLFLRDVPEILLPGGRIGVISYHSLEDRIVKNFFRAEAATRIPSGHRLIPDQPRTPRLAIVTKNPITPGEAECRTNPRARSAKFRIAERLDYGK